jgi:hypothetical protein
MSYSPKAFQIEVLGTSQIGKFISTHGTTGDVIIPDDDKFSFGTGSDASIYFDATNLVIADENIPVKIGHASNTVTIAGNLTVDGTTTSVNQTYIDVTNAFVFEGSSANLHETTLGIVDPTADATINLPAMAAATYYLPVLAAASTTAITATPEELNYLDVTTLGTAESSKAFTRKGDGTATFAGTTIADLGTVTTADINGGTIDGAIIGGASTAAGSFAALAATTGTFSGILKTDDTTDATSTTDGSLQTDGGLSVALDCIFGNDVKLLTDSSVFAMGVGSDFTITHDGSTGAAIAAGASGLAINTDTVTFGSANASDPLVIIQNTTNDTSSARLRFVKDKGAAGADGDDIGIIEFYGDDSAQTQTVFAKIVAEVSESLDTDEAGKLSFYVAESDGTTTALAAGLVLEGEHATNGEVDVTIGAGAASTTTVAGTLTMGTTAALTNAGLVAVANQSGITGLGTIGTGVWQGTAIASAYIADDAITGAKIALFDDSLAATTTHFLIADGTDYSSFALSGDVTCTNAGVVSIAANVVDGTHIALGSDEQGDIMYYDGTNWARLVHGTDGQFLKTQGDSANPVWAAATVSSLACDDLSVGDAAVTLSTSSGNITIETQATDTDIIFNVDDADSQVTALTLDGSDAGAAIFNSTIKGTVFKPVVEVISSANVTVSNGYTAITTAGSNRTATMPEATAALVGSTYTVKKVDSGSGNISVTAEGDGLIDGGASVVLYHQFESVTVICRAADVWDIV